MESEAQTPEYATLIAELASFRNKRLGGEPSGRTLAKAVGASPTTIGDWLRGARFPQQVDHLLALVQAVRSRAAASGGTLSAEDVKLLDTQRWERTYKAEVRRRAAGTRAAVEAEQSRAVLARMRPGQPLSEVTDPFHLEVHHAIGSQVAGLPTLPPYVPREHDRQLTDAVARAAAGDSQIAVLVGGSSTGKTRACWECLNRLREQDEQWRLWHPIEPTHSDAALAELADIAPRTVVWLNEAQFYLEPDNLGEQVAAGLRSLLRDPKRGPVLVLVTLWPDHWDTLTTRSDPDRHAHARHLLQGYKIKVPDAFTKAEVTALTGRADLDPRLAEAANHARDGQITQHLAGVPVLMDRYQEASPATKALIHAAMDARRLGAGPLLPLALLADAAPGYLTDVEWDQTGDEDDWLQRALEYVVKPCNGIPGILTPAKGGTLRNQRARRANTTARPTPAIQQPAAAQGPLYSLADYLDQHGRHRRDGHAPPIAFWTAVAAHAHPADLTALGEAAWERDLYFDAAQLRKAATAHGNSDAAAQLVDQLHALHPGDCRPSRWAATHAALHDPSGMSNLLEAMMNAGADSQVAMLLGRDPAGHVLLDDPAGVASLLGRLLRAGADSQVAVLLGRDPAGHVLLDDPWSTAWLLGILGFAGAESQVATLVDRVTAHVALSGANYASRLLHAMQPMGTDAPMAHMVERVASHLALDDPATMATLLEVLQEAGADGQLTVLLAPDPASHVALDDSFGVGRLMLALQAAGADEQLSALAERAAAHTVHDPSAASSLLGALLILRAEELETALAERVAAHIPLGNPLATAMLLDALQGAGSNGRLAVLLARDPATHVALDDSFGVGQLLLALQAAGADEQLAVLLARDPATHVVLDDSLGVGQLLLALQAAGADEQLAVLLARDPASHVALDDLTGTGRVMLALQAAGADEQLAALAERVMALTTREPAAAITLLDDLLPAGAHEHRAALAERATAHPVDGASSPDWLLDALQLVKAHGQAPARILWRVRLGNTTHQAVAQPADAFTAEAAQLSVIEGLEPSGDMDDHHREQFRFGREPNGSAAAPWTWNDLG